jgi:hypothetical protein
MRIIAVPRSPAGDAASMANQNGRGDGVSSTVRDLALGSSSELAERGPHLLTGVPASRYLYEAVSAS